MTAYQKFLTIPDPSPITDDQGNPVILTQEEQDRWRNYLDSRQRKRTVAPVTPATPTTVTATAAVPTDDQADLPF